MAPRRIGTGTMLLLLGAFANGTLNAGDLIVAQDGSGDFATIQAAADAADPGDSVRIKAGVYAEMVRITRSGSPNQPIVFEAFGDGTVVIDGSGHDACVIVSGCSYLEFRDLTLQAGAVAGFYAESPAAHLVLHRLTIKDILHPLRAVGYGAYFYALPDPIEECRITQCTVTHNSSHGIFLYGRNLDFLIQGNHVSYSGLEEGDWGHNIKTVVWHEDGPDNGPRRISIIDNELDHAWTQGIMTWNAQDVIIRENYCHHNGATGIQIEDGTRRFVVEGNLCEWNQQHYSTETGIWIDDAEDGLVQNNTLRHNQVGLKVSKSRQVIVRRNVVRANHRDNPEHRHNGGIFLLAYDQIDNSDIILVHNTLHDVGHVDLANTAFGIYQYGSDAINERIAFVNNIISETVSGYDLEVPTGTLTSDTNVYHRQVQSVYSWHGQTMGFEAYRTASGQDAHSRQADPGFVDAGAGDVGLRPESPCIDAAGGLAHVVESGRGNLLRVDDARYFCDGFGLVPGDLIVVGDGVSVRVAHVDLGGNELLLAREISYRAGDPVHYAYGGAGPDIGAVEMGADAASIAYLPHFAMTEGLWVTNLALFHSGDAPQRIGIFPFAEDGAAQDPVWAVLPAHGGLVGRLDEVVPELGAERGWLRIESEMPGLTGIMTFTFIATGATTSLPLTADAGTRLVFPRLDAGPQWTSGIAVANVSGDGLNLELHAWDSDGTCLETVTRSVPVGQRLVSMVDALFSVSLPEVFSLTVVGDAVMTGFALTFAPGNAQIIAVPAAVDP